MRRHWDAQPGWSAGFEQTIDLGDGTSPVENSGRVFISRPGRMRWEYAGGSDLVVGDGRWLWIYQASLEQAYKVSYDEPSVHGLVGALLGGAGQAGEDYELVSEAGREKGRSLFRLSSKAVPGLVFELTVISASSELESLVMTESGGSRNEVRFRSATSGSAPEPSLFRFTPPPGTDVVVRQ